MKRRLTLTLHLDAFDLALGGGYAEYDPDGELLHSAAYLAFGHVDLTPEEACAMLLEDWTMATTQQLELFS